MHTQSLLRQLLRAIRLAPRSRRLASTWDPDFHRDSCDISPEKLVNLSRQVVMTLLLGRIEILPLPILGGSVADARFLGAWSESAPNRFVRPSVIPNKMRNASEMQGALGSPHSRPAFSTLYNYWPLCTDFSI
jgi:hypothetical protein